MLSIELLDVLLLLTRSLTALLDLLLNVLWVLLRVQLSALVNAVPDGLDALSVVV